MHYQIGTDVGGTFTDLVLLSDGGDILVRKASTTPADRTDGVLNALRLIASDLGLSTSSLLISTSHFAHGTTAATNAFLERRGARTALLTTRGFADILPLQRSMASWTGLSADQSSHYSRRTMPAPIVDRGDIAEVDERVDYRGEVLLPLDLDGARETVRRLRDGGVESFAVCLLWSFRNPVHERALGALIRRECPDAYVTLSSELIPILGEYERTSTTAINSYLGPVLERYLTRLDYVLHTKGLSHPVSILDSGGGALSARDATARAAGLLGSGPAGGVLASARLAKRLGAPNVVTTDMGGTSFDVGLIVGGEPVYEQSREVGRFHVALTGIRVETIGSGGGSIARVHDGHLSVGPESAGAVPGPACYGRGAEHPTVTDADVVLGIIDPDYFLGGRMPLDPELAAKAISEHVAEPLGLDLLAAAAGIREVADNQMADVLRNATLRAGRDPRDFVLFAFGGAGPTHAHRYAAAAGMSRVVIPATATAHSALGCVLARRRRSISLAFGQHAPAGYSRLADHIDAGALESAFRQLESRCVDALGGDEIVLNRFVGMRFGLQVHELFVPAPDTDLESLVHRFLQQYEEIYGEGTALRESGVELTTVRVDAELPGTEQVLHRPDEGEVARPTAVRPVYFFESGTTLDTTVHHAAALRAGDRLDGPAIVDYPGTTAVIGPGQHGELDGDGNLILTLEPR